MATPENPDTPEAAPPTSSQDIPQPAEGDTSTTSYSHRRTGFVAQLPKEVRDQINQMILDGVPLAKIPPQIGDPAKHITEEHLRRWKAGGYNDWLLECQRREDMRFTREAALDLLEQKAGGPVEDAGRTIAAAQLYELLLSFDPRTFAGALAEKPELYLRLINALSRLSEADATSGHRRALQANIETAKADGAKNLVSLPTLKQIIRQIKLV